MGQLITQLVSLPGSLPTSPTSYSQCGKSGKTGTYPKSPETGKAGKVGTLDAIGILAPGQGAQLLTGLGALARIKEIDELAARITALEGMKNGND